MKEFIKTVDDVLANPNKTICKAIKKFNDNEFLKVDINGMRP
jgi:hypothetical protein